VKKRLFYIGSSIAIILVAALIYIRLTAAPIHAFDHSWDAQREITVDARIRSMSQRAQLDDYVSGIPPIGRRHLVLISASRSDSGAYYLFFYRSGFLTRSSFITSQLMARFSGRHALGQGPNQPTKPTVADLVSR
jgi:hypothetical protein